MLLYTHPFSSNCWKVLIALYENGIAFEQRVLENADAFAELAARWPIKKFPVLADGERTVIETSIIIEYLQLHYPGPQRLIPSDPEAALEVRFMDRVFDNYVQTPLEKVVVNQLRLEADRAPYGVTQAKQTLETIYGWLEKKLAGRQWAAGEDFTLADCAGAPFLFYADWVHPMEDRYPAVSAYRARLLARPSVKRCVEDARPYRHYFPLGAPDRD